MWQHCERLLLPPLPSNGFPESVVFYVSCTAEYDSNRCHTLHALADMTSTVCNHVCEGAFVCVGVKSDMGIYGRRDMLWPASGHCYIPPTHEFTKCPKLCTLLKKMSPIGPGVYYIMQ